MGSILFMNFKQTKGKRSGIGSMKTILFYWRSQLYFFIDSLECILDLIIQLGN